MAIGVRFPFQETNEGGVFRYTKSSEEAIRTNLISLLTTKKKQRVMNNNLFSPLYDQIFEQWDEISEDILDEKLKDVMAEMGLPPLKGLAPGMIEDAENALNPSPLMNAVFGSGYPQCKQVTMPVGDAYGRIEDPDTNEVWISNPETAVNNGNGYVQTYWIQDTDSQKNPINLTRDQWVAAQKTFNPDGTPVQTPTQEAFEDFLTKPATVITVGVLCLLALAFVK